MNDFSYRIIRSRRKTVQITVKDCEVCVRAPYGYSADKIEEFICEKRKWIERCMLKQKSVANKLSTTENKGYLWLLGEKFTCQDELNEKTVKRFYCERSDILKNKIDVISKECGLVFTSLDFSNAKTLWGTCDSKNNVRLNLRLSALPMHLIEYVIVHELSHTRQHNHSERFWNIVGAIMPDYKSRRKELKTYSWILNIYR